MAWGPRKCRGCSQTFTPKVKGQVSCGRRCARKNGTPFQEADASPPAPAAAPAAGSPWSADLARLEAAIAAERQTQTRELRALMAKMETWAPSSGAGVAAAPAAAPLSERVREWAAAAGAIVTAVTAASPLLDRLRGPDIAGMLKEAQEAYTTKQLAERGLQLAEVYAPLLIAKLGKIPLDEVLRTIGVPDAPESAPAAALPAPAAPTRDALRASNNGLPPAERLKLLEAAAAGLPAADDDAPEAMQ